MSRPKTGILQSLTFVVSFFFSTVLNLRLLIPQSVVAARLRVKFNISVTVHEYNLGIVLAENAEFCHLQWHRFVMFSKLHATNLAIETALKLHSKIMEVVAS